MTTTPITPARLSEIAMLCEEATPGPWRWGDWRTAFGLLESEFRCTLERSPEHGASEERVARYRDDGAERILSVEDDVERTADKRFIAASRTAIPELLAEIARLQASDLRLTETARAASENWMAACRQRDEARAEAKTWFDAGCKAIDDMGEHGASEVDTLRDRIAALETGLREACDQLAATGLLVNPGSVVHRLRALADSSANHSASHRVID